MADLASFEKWGRETATLHRVIFFDYEVFFVWKFFFLNVSGFIIIDSNGQSFILVLCHKQYETHTDVVGLYK